MDRKILQRLHEKLPKTGSPDFLEGASFMLAALEDMLDTPQEVPITLPDSVFCVDALRRHLQSGEGLTSQFLSAYNEYVHRNIREIYPTVSNTKVTITARRDIPALGPLSQEVTITLKLTHMDGRKSDYIYNLRVPIYERYIP